MPTARPNFPQDVFDNYGRLRANPKLNQNDIGDQLKLLYPHLFQGKAKSAVKAVIEQAREQGVDIPFAVPGGRPRMLPESDSRWRDRNPELVIPYSPRVIIGSDIHFPLHLKLYLERFIKVARVKQMETVVFNGDIFDNGHKGHGGDRSVWAPGWDDCMDSFHYFMVELLEECPSIQRIVSICGNHDDKTFRHSDREMEYRDYWNKACARLPGFKPLPEYDPLAPGHVGDGVEMYVTNRYYAYMKPLNPQAWPFTGPENFPTIFTHQKEYSRIHGRVEARLASVEPANTYSGHHHHLSTGSHESDLYHACGCGTGQDPTLAPYKNSRQSTHPKWNVGFITIEHNEPEKWRIFADNASWESRLGEPV